MIPVYKYRRSWKSWHIHASSSEKVMYIPKYKVIIGCSDGSLMSQGSINMSEEDKLIKEGEKIASEIHKKGINKQLAEDETTISEVYVVEYSDAKIKELIENIRKRNEISSKISVELELLKKVKPTVVSLLKLKYEVEYTCLCKPEDDCKQRQLKLEEQTLILPSNYDDTVTELNFDYCITTGQVCKSRSDIFFGGSFDKRDTNNASRNGFPIMKLISFEIIKDVPNLVEYLSFDEFMMKSFGAKIAFTKEE